MNPNVKATTIGIGSGLGAQVGAIAVYLIEVGTSVDMPTEIDQSIVGIVTAVVGFAIYKLLPASV